MIREGTRTQDYKLEAVARTADQWLGTPGTQAAPSPRSIDAAYSAQHPPSQGAAMSARVSPVR